MTAPPINTPSKPEVFGAAVGRNQKDRRYHDTFWDEYKTSASGRFPRGRPWTGPREIAANADILQDGRPLGHGFCGGLQQGEYIETDGGMVDRAATFASVWFAPWVPIEKYFKFNLNRRTISFDMPRMIREENDGLIRYYRAASKLGIQLGKIVEPGVIPHPQIVVELGEPSRMVKVAEAAMARDPWLLGFIDEPNPQLAEILGYNGSGILQATSYFPPEQTKVVEQVLAAPAGQDLIELIARTVHAVMDQRDQAKMNERMEKARAGKAEKGES